MANEKRLIDANALLEKIQFRSPVIDTKTKTISDCVQITRETIVNAPTVDAMEVIHAKWENVQKGKGCCSNCHRLDSVDSLATHCRYCGAKMDGGNKNV